MSFGNNDGKAPKSQNSSFMSIFQNFLVNQVDSPPSGYLSESDDDGEASSLLQSVTPGGKSSVGAKKERPVEVVKPFVNEQEGQVLDESVVAGTLNSENEIVTSPDPRPLRASARRKVTEKKKAKPAENVADEEIDKSDSDFDLGDSDTDPAWSPLKENSDKDSRRGGRRKRRATPPSMSSDSDDEPLIKRVKSPGNATDKADVKHRSRDRPLKPKETSAILPVKPQVIPTSLPVKPIVSNDENISSQAALTAGTDFNPGDFVVMKEDLDKEHPPLWRLDGKTLLQKYQPFDKAGEMLYRNLTTFSGWTSLSRPRFLRAPISFRVQTRKEIVVEFLQSELEFDDRDITDNISQDLESLQDAFEVFIQSLISHVLDMNFLPEIFRENDEFFVSNLKIIDDVVERRKTCLVALCGLELDVLEVLDTWPLLELREGKKKFKESCKSCGKMQLCKEAVLDGQPYDKKTLEPSTIPLNVAKSLAVCTDCTKQIELYHKVTHQRHRVYAECAKQVCVKKSAEGHDVTTILNDMLMDEAWLSETISTLKEPLQAIDRLDVKNVRKVIAEKYQACKPTKI